MAIEGFPPLFPDELKEEPRIKHQWLYSVVPVSVNPYTFWDSMKAAFETEYALKPVLSGYCRGCGRAFSKIIPVNLDGTYLETPMDVEAFGCIA